jgi:hypothetical protein
MLRCRLPGDRAAVSNSVVPVTCQAKDEYQAWPERLGVVQAGLAERSARQRHFSAF